MAQVKQCASMDQNLVECCSHHTQQQQYCTTHSCAGVIESRERHIRVNEREVPHRVQRHGGICRCVFLMVWLELLLIFEDEGL